MGEPGREEPKITVRELIERNLDDLIIERPCLEILMNSEVLDSIQIINGLEKGMITAALLMSTHTVITHYIFIAFNSFDCNSIPEKCINLFPGRRAYG